MLIRVGNGKVPIIDIVENVGSMLIRVGNGNNLHH